MRAIVIYESMYGNTHTIADAIGRGLAAGNEVSVVPVADATPDLLGEADLVVAGGPTHIHGMTGARSRQAAAEAAHKDGSGLTLEPHVPGPGLRDWFGTVGYGHGCGAAFDTRVDGPAVLTEPSSNREKPPPPREPTTTRSASDEAPTSSCAGRPLTARSVTDAGPGSPARLTACCTASCAAWRIASVAGWSAGYSSGLPVQ